MAIRTRTFLQDIPYRGAVAYIPIILVTFLMFCGSSWQMFLSTTDPARYQCYALTFWLGSSATTLPPPSQCSFLHISTPQAAFHMLPLEYPPLTLLPFSLALIAPFSYYQMAFALVMSLISVLIYCLLLRYGPHRAALIFALYIFIGAVAIAQQRFDLIPAALTLLCMIAAERKHWTSAYIALAFGVLLKLYPILLFPALFIAEQQAEEHLPSPLRLTMLLKHLWLTIPRWQWKNSIIFLSILVGVTGAFALLNFQEAVVSQLSYFTQRPVQTEAIGSTLLWLATFFGVPLQIVSSYGSLNVLSTLDGTVSLMSSVFFVLGYTYTIWIQWRGKLDITQASIALLLVFIGTGKVFSPQYLIWLIPLLAYTGAFNSFWLLIWGTISLLTSFTYIYLYSRAVGTLIPFVPGFFQIVGVRNMLFVLLTLAYLFNWFQIRHRQQPHLSL